MVKKAQKRFWKMRQQARLIVANVGPALFLKAQDSTCPICNQRLYLADITVDHAWPLQICHENYGNIFLTHYECNQAKSDREPTEDEIASLKIINERLGYIAEETRYQCRVVMVNRYARTALWLNELRSRGAPAHEIERVEMKLLGMEEHLGPFINNK
jgi:hypothetical protein